MNTIQKMSQTMLANRLKLELGVALEADIDYPVLRAMSLQLRNERTKKTKIMHAGNYPTYLHSAI
jgi:hypothetical protein